MYKFTKLSLGWAEGTGVFSRAIQKMDDGKYSHVYLKFVIEGAPILIYESHVRGGVQITPYYQLKQAMIRGKVSSIKEYTLSDDPETIAKVWDESIELHGSGYDLKQIAMYFIWMRYMRRRGKKLVNLFINGKYTCNEFVITACKAAIEDFMNLDFSYTPEGLYRHFYKEPSN